MMNIQMKKIIPIKVRNWFHSYWMVKITNESSEKEEHVIPLWGEEITINKKMVKIGEIVIRKYEINEKQKIDVDLKSEQTNYKIS